jgi:hypothetical protein
VISGSDDATVYLCDARTQWRCFAVRVGMPVIYVNFRSDVGLVVGSNTGILALEIVLGFKDAI